ncbi:MAG: hypothetical protein WC001_01775 [Desulfurivibrionaceae bacterium]
MKRNRRPSHHKSFFRITDSPRLAAGCLALALLILDQPLPLQAEEIQVLTVRPEKVRDAMGQKNSGQPLTRDPFNWSRKQISLLKQQEPREKSSSIGGLTITGIIWDKNKPQAVINDRLVGRGDTINDSVITKILKDLVIFEQNGISHTLWLESSPRPLPLKDKKP